MITAGRFLLRICCDSAVASDDAIRVLRAFSDLSPDVLVKVHSTPICYFLWNLHALLFERCKTIASTVEQLQSTAYWDQLVKITIARLKDARSYQQKLDGLVLAGAVAVLIPSRLPLLRRELLFWHEDARPIVKLVTRLTFVPSYFAFQGLALVSAPIPRAEFRARQKELRQKLSEYSEVGPALKAIADRL